MSCIINTDLNKVGDYSENNHYFMILGT